MTAEERNTLLTELRSMRRSILEVSSKGSEILTRQVIPANRDAATNLLQYLAFRQKDYRQLQDKLSLVGLSSLRAAEAHVLQSINNVIGWLDPNDMAPYPAPPDAKEALKRLEWRKCELFKAGDQCADRFIMVTLDASRRNGKDHLKELIDAGMNCARINAGHDKPEDWLRTARNVREAAEACGKPCAVYFDLSGPKIRIVRLLNKHGDAREKVSVAPGQRILITEPGYIGDSPKLVRIEVGFEGVFENAEKGQRILFDDGVIIAQAIDKDPNAILAEVIRTKGSGERKLKIHNGVALPALKLNTDASVLEDLEALKGMADHIDIVGISFVQSARDVQKMTEVFRNNGWNHLGLVAKIETVSAFESLPQILFALLALNRSGVMIARGDLALEVGVARMAEVQEEILWMCEAASVPVIWATQVLETLTKEGIPTRAEISDASMSVQAECVMLNKGEYVKESVETLRKILSKMRLHHNKKASEMRKLSVAVKFFEQAEHQFSS